MSKLSAPEATPKPIKGEVKKSQTKPTRDPRRVFLLAAADMSWQLAIVVLVPIIGGFELDKHLGTAPVFMVIGFLLAMGGMYAVMKRMLDVVNRTPLKPKGHK